MGKTPQNAYFDKIEAINDIFDQIYAYKPDWNKF